MPETTSTPAIADLTVNNQGSIFLLTPETPAGKAWIDQNIPDEAMRMGPSVVVEHRYIGNIVEGAIHDGMIVN
jgi:hypothetical protein